MRYEDLKKKSNRIIKICSIKKIKDTLSEGNKPYLQKDSFYREKLIFNEALLKPDKTCSNRFLPLFMLNGYSMQLFANYVLREIINVNNQTWLYFIF